MKAAITDLETVPKGDLSNAAGMTYADYRRGLTPRRGRIARDLALIHAGLVAAALGAVWGGRRGIPAWGIAPPVAVAVGLLLSSLYNFFHEAAHFHLAESRPRNDALANVFIGSLLGQEISRYRLIHFGHHQFLGAVDDTENTYFDPLNIRFFAFALFGLNAVRVLIDRRRRAARSTLERQGAGLAFVLLLAAAAIHGSVVAAAWAAGQAGLAAGWAAGVLVFFPFFGSLRQLLEHRDELAASAVDYRTTPHGKVSRLFHEGIFGSTLGSAGFTRHLLHHWDPQISYTRLRDVEAFLLETRLREGVLAARTSYLRAFLRLFRFSWSR